MFASLRPKPATEVRLRDPNGVTLGGMSQEQNQATRASATSPIRLVDASGNETHLSIENGDLIAKAIDGPNAGKSVNLTFGKWD